MIITAEEARKLTKTIELPDGWLDFSLQTIEEAVKFAAESLGKNECTWNCSVNTSFHKDKGDFQCYKVKGKELEQVVDVLKERGYGVDICMGSFRYIVIKW